MKTSTKNPDATIEAFEAEARLLHLSHSSVIRIIAISRHPKKVIMMELVPEAKTLQRLINNEENYEWRHFARQLVSALIYLHQHDILHLDIKPANILVTQQNSCKVIDFGCSQHAATPAVSALQGTIAYRAPELFRGRLPNTKADIYSLGITLWTTKTQKAPYGGQNNDMIIYQVVSQHRRPAPDPDFNPLWHQDPEQRPEAVQLSF